MSATTRTVSDVEREIRNIDRRIDRIHAKLSALESIDPMSAESWKAAWDKHPDLHAKEIALYQLRGDLQDDLSAVPTYGFPKDIRPIPITLQDRLILHALGVSWGDAA